MFDLRSNADERLNEQVSRYLFDIAPIDQRDEVMRETDIDPEFMGFVAVYQSLSVIIPRHWAVVDIGCAYAPQAFLFQHHRAYVGVDPSSTPRFHATNTTHVTETAGEYVKRGDFPDGPVFAICSYVPDWHGDDARALVRGAFENVFTYYPSGERCPAIKYPSKSPPIERAH